MASTKIGYLVQRTRYVLGQRREFSISSKRFHPICYTTETVKNERLRFFVFRERKHINGVWIFRRKIGSINSGIEKECPKSKLSNYPEQKVTFYTCDKLYERWRKQKKIIKVPSSGIYPTLSYLDTMVNKGEQIPPITESSPTILCIHGIPGNFGVFSHLIEELGSRGVRTVVPNFPDILYFPGKHKKELFRHSVEEKTEMFKDFLKALNIKKLDGIIAHSSAIYPALRLVLDSEIDVKCQILFNTGGHKRTTTMKPYLVVWICCRIYLYAWGRTFIHKAGKFILKYILRSPIKDENMHGIMLLGVTMIFSQYWKTKDMFKEIARREVPTLLCFSEDDKVVQRKLTYDVISLLGASRENISYYDESAKLKIKGNDKPWLRILSFEKGSHYVFRKYPEVCNKAVIEFLDSTGLKTKVP